MYLLLKNARHLFLFACLLVCLFFAVIFYIFDPGLAHTLRELPQVVSFFPVTFHHGIIWFTNVPPVHLKVIGVKMRVLNFSSLTALFFKSTI